MSDFSAPSLSERSMDLVKEYGDQAYYKAIRFTVVATNLGDLQGAEMFAACAKELMDAGYHKHTESL